MGGQEAADVALWLDERLSHMLTSHLRVDLTRAPDGGQFLMEG